MKPAKVFGKLSAVLLSASLWLIAAGSAQAEVFDELRISLDRIDSALDRGDTNAATLALMDAADRPGADRMPLLRFAAFDALRLVRSMHRFAVSGDTVAFARPGALFTHDPATGDLEKTTDATGPQPLGTIAGQALDIRETDRGLMFAVLADAVTAQAWLVPPDDRPVLLQTVDLAIREVAPDGKEIVHRIGQPMATFLDDGRLLIEGPLEWVSGDWEILDAWYAILADPDSRDTQGAKIDESADAAPLAGINAQGQVYLPGFGPSPSPEDAGNPESLSGQTLFCFRDLVDPASRQAFGALIRDAAGAAQLQREVRHLVECRSGEPLMPIIVGALAGSLALGLDPAPEGETVLNTWVQDFTATEWRVYGTPSLAVDTTRDTFTLALADDTGVWLMTNMPYLLDGYPRFLPLGGPSEAAVALGGDLVAVLVRSDPRYGGDTAEVVVLTLSGLGLERKGVATSTVQPPPLAQRLSVETSNVVSFAREGDRIAGEPIVEFGDIAAPEGYVTLDPWSGEIAIAPGGKWIAMIPSGPESGDGIRVLDAGLIALGEPIRYFLHSSVAFRGDGPGLLVLDSYGALWSWQHEESQGWTRILLADWPETTANELTPSPDPNIVLLRSGGSPDTMDAFAAFSDETAVRSAELWHMHPMPERGYTIENVDPSGHLVVRLPSYWHQDHARFATIEIPALSAAIAELGISLPAHCRDFRETPRTSSCWRD